MRVIQAGGKGSKGAPTMIAIVALVGACSSSSSPSVYNTWEYVDGTTGDGLTLNSDGTYTATVLLLTSSDSGEAAIETGTFTSTATTLSFTPKQSSCPGADPPYSASYTLTNGDLDVGFSGTIRVYTVDTSAGGTFNITTGCFDSGGNFTPSPVANVTP